MRDVEVVEDGWLPGGSDPEHDAFVARSSVNSCSVEVSIGSLHQWGNGIIAVGNIERIKRRDGARGRDLVHGAIVDVRASRLCRSIKVAIRALDWGRLRVRPVASSGEIVEYCQAFTWRYLEHVAVTEFPTTESRAVKIPVRAQCKTAVGFGTVGSIKAVDHGKGSRGSDLEYCAQIICSTVARGSVRVPITPLRHNPRV